MRWMKWMLKVVRKHGLADGQSVCIDGTTLQANAAVKSLVRRDTGVSYGAELRAPLRNGRAEAGLCAEPGQCIEAGTGAGGSVQHGIAAAAVERMGQAAASSGTENRLDCAPIRCIHRQGGYSAVQNWLDKSVRNLFLQITAALGRQEIPQ